MTYKSKKPTPERRAMYEFLEEHKTGGTVSARKLGKYITERGYKLRAGESRKGESHFSVHTKTGAEIMRGGLEHKSRRLKMWYVD